MFFQLSDGETMCSHDTPTLNPGVLTTFDYPSMVTASQCQCTIIPNSPIQELNIHIQLHRADRTTECHQTEITITYHNFTNNVCPMSTAPDDRTTLVLSLALNMQDKAILTVWNSQMEFMNAKIEITSGDVIDYTVDCVTIAGSPFWPDEYHGIGFDDGILPGLKVAVVVIFFLLVFLLWATVRFVARMQSRKKQFEKKKLEIQRKKTDQNQMKRLNEGCDNRAGPTSSIDSIHHSSIPSQSANLVAVQVPLIGRMNNGNLTMDCNHYKFPTGYGCLWPLQEEQVPGLLSPFDNQEYQPASLVFAYNPPIQSLQTYPPSTQILKNFPSSTQSIEAYPKRRPADSEDFIKPMATICETDARARLKNLRKENNETQSELERSSEWMAQVHKGTGKNLKTSGQNELQMKTPSEQTNDGMDKNNSELNKYTTNLEMLKKTSRSRDSLV